jgi:sugar phosphate isomerase/epimerase
MRVVILRKQVGTDNISVDALRQELLERLKSTLEGLENMSLEELFNLAKLLGVDTRDIEEVIEKIKGAAQELQGVGGPAYGRLYKQTVEEYGSPAEMANEIKRVAGQLASLLRSYSSWDALSNLPSKKGKAIANALGTLRELLDKAEYALSMAGAFGPTYWDQVRPRWEEWLEEEGGEAASRGYGL